MKYIKLFDNYNQNCSDVYDITSITGMSILSELEKPLYYLLTKRKRAKLLYISPQEYLRRISKNFKMTYDETINSQHVDYDKVNKYVSDMKSGDIFPTVWYERDDSRQEGRHRALASIELGCDIIPAIEFSSISSKELDEFINETNNYTFEEMSDYFIELGYGYKGITQLGYNDYMRYNSYKNM